MIRPPFSADKKTLNDYIDHLEWKMTHKDENIRSLSAQCDAYAKSLKRSHEITQNLIDNVTASLPVLSPGSSHVTVSEICRMYSVPPQKIIGHTNMSKDMGLTIGEFRKKYGLPILDIRDHMFVPSLKVKSKIIEESQEENDTLKDETAIIHKGIYMSIPLYPGVKISQYQNILNVLKPEIIEETPEENDVSKYTVIISKLIVYVIICVIIVLIVIASKNK